LFNWVVGAFGVCAYAGIAAINAHIIAQRIPFPRLRIALLSLRFIAKHMGSSHAPSVAPNRRESLRDRVTYGVSPASIPDRIIHSGSDIKSRCQIKCALSAIHREHCAISSANLIGGSNMVVKLSIRKIGFVLLLAAATCGRNVALAQTQSAPEHPKVDSTLNTVQTDSAAPHVLAVYTTSGYFEAPNWARDGASLLFDEDGKIMKVAAAGGTPVPLDIGAAIRCNGSHGLSPDGKLLAITCNMPDQPGARVYILPSTGGTPHVVTENANSYWHSWSPDGKTILFTRPDRVAGGINVFSIGVDGHDEKPLTSGTGTSDDPDFSPDGRYIYFNSDRSGTMQIWRMHPDGSAAEQITSDEMVNWTPHPSPDGKSIVFLSYEKGTAGHPSNKNVSLRLMSLADRKVKVLVNFVGGSGSFNVPSWAPDSRHLAFVSYKLEAAN
jgi:dipeptidyl aminopeptidase/acylaminoacyl peptidase